MSENAKDRMLSAQEIYEEVKKDNAELNAMLDAFPEKFARMKQLLSYYESDWMEDMETLDRQGVNIEVMGQDPIYEEIQEQYQTIKKILLACAEYINRS